MIFKCETLLNTVINELFFYNQAIINVENLKEGICCKFKSLDLCSKLVDNGFFISSNSL